MGALHIHMTFKNTEPTEGLKSYLEKKLLNVTQFIGSLKDAHCIFKVEGHRHSHIVHVTLHGNNVEFFAEGKSDDMYASVDLVVHKLDLQLTKFKEKVKEHKNFEKSHEGELRYAENLFDEKRSQSERKKNKY